MDRQNGQGSTEGQEIAQFRRLQNQGEEEESGKRWERRACESRSCFSGKALGFLWRYEDLRCTARTKARGLKRRAWPPFRRMRLSITGRRSGSALRFWGWPTTTTDVTISFF